MKKLTLLCLLLTLSSINLVKASSRLKEIDQNLAQIKKYRDQGIKSVELDSQEAALIEEKKKLKKKEKRKAKAITLKEVPLEPTYRKFRPQDYLNFLKNIENDSEKLRALDTKLAEERGELADLLLKESGDKNRISELRDEIDVLEWQKNKIESRITKTSLDNNLMKFKMGGIFDFYYGLSSNRGGDNNTPTSPHDNSDDTNSFRYYDNLHDDFTVNLVELSFSAVLERTSFVLELDFGEFAEQNAPGDEITKHIGQAFITYDFDGHHNVAAGKMYTHVGFELAKPIDNWNYSRSYAFGFGGPFWHEGVAVKGNYENGMRWGIFGYDASDVRKDNNDDKTYGVQLGWSGDKLTVIYNYISGPESLSNGKYKRIHEANAQYNLTEGLSVAFDTVYGVDDEVSANSKDHSWEAYVGYINFKANENWRFTARSEIFKETTSSSSTSFKLNPATKPSDVVSHTLTIARSLAERNELRLEFRHDSADEKIYLNNKGKTRNVQDTAVLAWVVGI